MTGRRRRQSSPSFNPEALKIKLKLREQGREFFCAQCRMPRRIRMNTQIMPKHFVQIGLTTVVFTMLTWNWLGWKGMVAFVPIWAIFETFFRIKLRAALTCYYCGFDPYLYLQDDEKARTAIEQFWRRRFSEKGIPFPGAHNHETQQNPIEAAPHNPRPPEPSNPSLN